MAQVRTSTAGRSLALLAWEDLLLQLREETNLSLCEDRQTLPKESSQWTPLGFEQALPRSLLLWTASEFECVTSANCG
jgi:hypothetical protein